MVSGWLEPEMEVPKLLIVTLMDHPELKSPTPHLPLRHRGGMDCRPRNDVQNVSVTFKDMAKRQV